MSCPPLALSWTSSSTSFSSEDDGVSMSLSTVTITLQQTRGKWFTNTQLMLENLFHQNSHSSWDDCEGGWDSICKRSRCSLTACSFSFISWFWFFLQSLFSTISFILRIWPKMGTRTCHAARWPSQTSGTVVKERWKLACGANNYKGQ